MFFQARSGPASPASLLMVPYPVHTALCARPRQRGWLVLLAGRGNGRRQLRASERIAIADTEAGPDVNHHRSRPRPQEPRREDAARARQVAGVQLRRVAARAMTAVGGPGALFDADKIS